MRALIAAALALSLAGCAVPSTPARDAFAAEAAYIAAARPVAAYLRSPAADQTVAATLRRLEREAYEAVAAVRAAPTDRGRVLNAQLAVDALARFTAERGMR